MKTKLVKLELNKTLRIVESVLTINYFEYKKWNWDIFCQPLSIIVRKLRKVVIGCVTCSGTTKIGTPEPGFFHFVQDWHGFSKAES